MKNKLINDIEANMASCLNNEQLAKLDKALKSSLSDVEFIENGKRISPISEVNYLNLFI